MTAIVDTNVILVANGQHAEVSPECVAACALRLQDIMKNGKLALDDEFRILIEYQKKTLPKKGNRPGDAFVRWALQNNANTDRVALVPIQEHPSRGFVSFPEDKLLENFDPPDRKFVAVAGAHPGTPSILQATDSKWVQWSETLIKYSIHVEFVCPSDIKKFNKKKKND